ncbi:FkbM family methyltransferase [Planctomycetota bacterium]
MKRQIQTMMGRDIIVETDCCVEKTRLGSSYGGWEVADRWIDGDSIIYSFGVGEDITFDLELINKYGVTIHAFDPTPRSIEWIHKQNTPGRFVLHEYGLADFDGPAFFNPPENPEHISHTILPRTKTQSLATKVIFKRLESIMMLLNHSRIDLLKMDIEGAEYLVIDDLITCQVKPSQLLIEFHHRFPNIGIQKTKEALKKLKSYGYCLFSVSDSGEEYGFIREIDIKR